MNLLSIGFGQLLTTWDRARKGEEGQGLVEYALIISLISVVAIVVLTTIGTDVRDKLCEVVDALGGGDCS
jgi:pilus assembly protein Flp/PilA